MPPRPIATGLLALAALTTAAFATDSLPAKITVNKADVPTYRILSGKGEATLLLNATTGSPEAAISLLTLAPGAEVPLHTHPTSTEFLYIEQGACTLTIAGVQAQARAGSAVRIPAGAPHTAKVTSAEPLRAVQFYVGPGPEQRFLPVVK